MVNSTTTFQPLIEVVILAIIPLSMIVPKVIPPKYRFTVLGGILAAIIIDLMLFRTPFHDLGIRADNFFKSLPWYLGFALLGSIAIIMYTRWKRISPLSGWKSDPHLLFWFIPISIAQQFVFFGFIFSRLNLFLPIIIAIALNVIIFSCAHLMYQPKGRAFAVTFLAGLGFSVIYTFIPNIVAGSLAHMILNFTVVQRNLFTPITAKNIDN